MNDKDTTLSDRLKALWDAALKPEDETDEEYPCYGCVRGNRRAFNIELRRLQGTWPAPEYAWLVCAEWCPVEKTFGNRHKVKAGSIVLHYESDQTITVSGRNLREVHLRILEHQVKYIAEIERSASQLAGDDEVIVTRIEVVNQSTTPLKQEP